jgi:CBS domain-containing protein
MNREPIILLVGEQELEAPLRQRYSEGYRILAPTTEENPAQLLEQYHSQGEVFALFVVEHQTAGLDGAAFLEFSSTLFPEARKLLLTDEGVELANSAAADYTISKPWTPQKLYPLLDELLAEWRASVEMPFIYVKGIMTVRTVRIRIGDSLHRAAEVIALSGVGDLMVIDEHNSFVGVLSVGDVLRAAMPDVGEILEEGGTLERAFRLFMRKGSELMYQPIEPLIIRNPLVVDPDDHVAKVAALMLERNIHRLPVVKDGHLLGTVGRTDICQAVVGTL